jgi:hypothetical protein
MLSKVSWKKYRMTLGVLGVNRRNNFISTIVTKIVNED